MLNISSYDEIVLDGFGTLYDKNYTPLPGSIDLLDRIFSKSILFSNIGSMDGKTLRSYLDNNYPKLPSSILTSFDLLLGYLKRNNINKVIHYGGSRAAKALSKNGIILDDQNVDVILFTSLPSPNWVKSSQLVLQKLNSQSISKLILANPDRMLPGHHVGINVGMMFDMLTKDWPLTNHQIVTKEIGKPNLSRLDLNLNSKSKILVIGDNKLTDGGLAKKLNADFCLISEIKRINKLESNSYICKSLMELTHNAEK
jgi:ribonucleotide monophosphatase NagD (HAD superfamily)